MVIQSKEHCLGAETWAGMGWSMAGWPRGFQGRVEENDKIVGRRVYVRVRGRHIRKLVDDIPTDLPQVVPLEVWCPVGTSSTLSLHILQHLYRRKEEERRTEKAPRLGVKWRAGEGSLMHGRGVVGPAATGCLPPLFLLPAATQWITGGVELS